MPEKRKPMRTVKVVYVCDECGEGEMERRSIGRQYIDPAGRRTHVCTHCGHTQVFVGKSYPRIAHEEVETA